MQVELRISCWRSLWVVGTLCRSGCREPAPGASRSFRASPSHRASSSAARSAASVGVCKHHEETSIFRFTCNRRASILVFPNTTLFRSITCQSTRTHNSRRRLRRKCWWSGHFYVMPQVAVLSFGFESPCRSSSVSRAGALCGSWVLCAEAGAVNQRQVPAVHFEHRLHIAPRRQQRAVQRQSGFANITKKLASFASLATVAPVSLSFPTRRSSDL